MDLSRKIGIGIVMIIPSFVGGGAVWNILHSWVAVILWLLIMASIYGGILLKNLSHN